MKNLARAFTTLLIIALSVSQYAFANQQKPKPVNRKKHNTPIKTYKDSIALKNIVSFDKSAYSVIKNKPKYANVIQFTLSITNNTNAAIPDPVSIKGSKYVKLYINGHLNNPKMLYDESHDAGDRASLIIPGTSQTFHCDWLASRYTSIQKKYGTKYTVQWSYLNIMSKKVAVDMVKHTAKLIN